MVILVEKMLVVNAEGVPTKCGLYLVPEGEYPPEDAPVGSRAVFESGRVEYKSPSGWATREGSA